MRGRWLGFDRDFKVNTADWELALKGSWVLG
jgi:hypothetical protein